MKIFMKVRFITVIILTFFGSLNVAAKEKKSKEIPYFLKEYAAQYQKSPREATLAWFEQARMGMFIHWGVRGKHHSAWAMYNKVIQLEEYQQLAHDVDASKFSALEIVKLAEESGMCYITFVAELSNV